MLAHLYYAVGTLVGHKPPDVGDGKVETLSVGGRSVGNACKGCLYLLENVRVAQRAPGYHNAVAAGVIPHRYGGAAARHVAVAYYRDREGCLGLSYNLPVRSARVHLLPGAPVYGHERRAGGLRHAGKVHTVDVAAVPALAEFY